MKGGIISVFRGADKYTTDTANRLLRLPMYEDIKEEVNYVSEQTYNFIRRTDMGLLNKKIYFDSFEYFNFFYNRHIF